MNLVVHAEDIMTPRNLLERFLAERVEADVDSFEAGAAQVGRLLFEQDAIGR